MKAIRVRAFGDPEVMGCEDIPELHPGAGEIVVTVRAAGVNPADTYIRSGQYALKPELPYTPGMDAAGVVHSIGDDVSRVSIGDRVYVAGSLTGTYAEQTLCKESQAHRLPDHVTFQQGAALGVPYAIAYRALFMRARARANETVLVHGATGGVGIAAVQWARAAGLTVIGTGGEDRGLELILAQGAHHALNHHDPDHLEQVRIWNRGKGVDIVLEMLANVNLGHDLKILEPDGCVVVIGSRGTVEIDPRDVMSREASIIGVLLFAASDQELEEIHAAIGAGLENRTLLPVIRRDLFLTEAPEAHRQIMEGSGFGKIVLTP